MSASSPPPAAPAAVHRLGAGVPKRVRWTLELLELEPHHLVLEIGAAPGVAGGLVCERLTSGRMVALDRSPRGAMLVERRNRPHVESGRLEVRVASLASARLPAALRFDRAFAINVNVFWTSPARAECAALARLVAPGGVLVLAFSAPDQRHQRAIDGAARALSDHGFTDVRPVLGPAAAALVAAPPPTGGSTVSP